MKLGLTRETGFRCQYYNNMPYLFPGPGKIYQKIPIDIIYIIKSFTREHISAVKLSTVKCTLVLGVGGRTPTAPAPAGQGTGSPNTAASISGREEGLVCGSLPGFGPGLTAAAQASDSAKENTIKI